MSLFEENDFIFFDFCFPLFEQRLKEMTPIVCNGCKKNTTKEISCLTSCNHFLCISCQQKYKDICPFCKTKNYTIFLD